MGLILFDSDLSLQLVKGTIKIQENLLNRFIHPPTDTVEEAEGGGAAYRRI